MLRIGFAICGALIASVASAELDYVTVRACKSMFFGKLSEDKTQDKINKMLLKALQDANAKKIYYIKYGNDTSGLFRNKENGCIVVTAWIDRK